MSHPNADTLKLMVVSDSEDPHEETSITGVDPEVAWNNEKLDEDTFGLVICSICHDLYLLAKGKGFTFARYLRLMTTSCLLVSCLGLQIFLLTQVKFFVSARVVHDVRVAYDKYEAVMYQGHTWNYSLTPTLERRGISGYFNESLFDTLSDDDMESVCCISFSQPWFSGVVLLIWTVCCLSDIRRCSHLFSSLINHTDLCRSMEDAFDISYTGDGNQQDCRYLVARLTITAKLYIIWLVLLPRFLITCFLLWVGCRLLVATMDFSDLILNAVALEFVMMLKDMIYLALVPRRSKTDLTRTQILPAKRNQANEDTVSDFAPAFFWGALSVLWVLLYMGTPYTPGFQQVLGHYQWDIRHACTAYVKSRYAV